MSTDEGSPGDPSDQSSPPVDRRPIIIGLYGVSGSGKSFLLEGLKEHFDSDQFLFFEDSTVLGEIVGSGGLKEFRNMDAETKREHRERAIENIRDRCARESKIGVVAGHAYLWERGQSVPIITPLDLQIYTHIIYNNVPPAVILQRSKDDRTRTRRHPSVEQLSRWQETEKKSLRNSCVENGILFCNLRVPHFERAMYYIKDLIVHTEESNLQQAQDFLKKSVASDYDELVSTVFVFNRDKTLSAQDTGSLFWQKRHEAYPNDLGAKPVDKLFSVAGYTYQAFRQATLFYGEACDNEQYESLCKEVAADVQIHSESISFLQMIALQDTARAVVITSGLRYIWQETIRRDGLSELVHVIGGGRISDGFVVTADVKQSLVTILREHYKLRTWAFGDSPLDIGMLIAADHAVVVVGDEAARSKGMEAAVLKAHEEGGMRAYQTSLFPGGSLLLDLEKLLTIYLDNQKDVTVIFGENPSFKRPKTVWIAEANAAKLLATPMRDAEVWSKTSRGSSSGRISLGSYIPWGYRWFGRVSNHSR